MGVFDLTLQHLKTLFEVREFVKGKLDMQKSLYFMKELGYLIPFNYRWSKLGPYSYELAHILNRLTTQGYLKYTGRYELNEKYFRFIKPEVKERFEKFFFDIEKLCNEKKLSDVDFIECAASLHFIYKNSETKNKEEVFGRLASLKPNRMTALKPLEADAWNFLQEHSLLS